ncbi:hypothetical protein ANO11243_028700 [Dothideomycetidae sp. 11243]|nr:hypothetical protein ANO11243_028700 [fungal sp. No.11243]
MAQVPTKEGDLPLHIPSIDKPCFTHFKVFGDLPCGKPPVVCIHGGPGAGHEYLLPFAALWPQFGLPVVFYDQIGCASSTHLREKAGKKAGDKAFWQIDVFLAELDNLLDHLQIRDGPGYHILGQSFGGKVGAAFACSRPSGLKRLILANSLASNDHTDRGVERRLQALPQDTQRVLRDGNQRRDFESAAYKQAMTAYMAPFMCRTSPLPSELLAAMKHLNDDKTVHSTMYGPSTACPTGSMSGWTCIPHLHKITAPTLVYNGEFDSSEDEAQVPFFELIPRVRWITFPDAAHMCHLEGRGIRERVLQVVGDFLAQAE